MPHQVLHTLARRPTQALTQAMQEPMQPTPATIITAMPSNSSSSSSTHKDKHKILLCLLSHQDARPPPPHPQAMKTHLTHLARPPLSLLRLPLPAAPSLQLQRHLHPPAQLQACQ